MSSPVVQSPASARALAEPASPISWTPFVWFGTILALCYWPILNALVYQWQNDEDMSHGFFVPFIAGFIIWERRSSWMNEAKRNSWGLLVLVWGMLQLWVGSLGAELFLQRTAFLITVLGLVFFYGGTRVIRTLSLPLFLLLFMIPIPGILLKQITFPLQLVASSLAEKVLEIAGYLVIRDGNMLELSGYTLSVVEACSGLRALHALAFFSLSYGYLFDSRPWVRWALFSAAIPVAIVTNAARVVIIGVLGEYDRKLADGFYHSLSGWILFVMSIGCLVLVHKLLNLKCGNGAE